MTVIAAAGRGDLEALRDALGAGADANAPDPSGATPLVVACGAGRIAAVHLLLAHGAVVTPEAWRAASEPGEPALVFLLETADGKRVLPAWLEAQIDQEKKAAGLPRALNALAGANEESRRRAIDELAAAAKAGVSMGDALPALAAALSDADAVRGTAAVIIDALHGQECPIPPDSWRRALPYVLSESGTPEETALIQEALAALAFAGGESSEEKIEALVRLLRANDQEKRRDAANALDGNSAEVLTEQASGQGRAARVSAFLLASRALGRASPEWDRVDHVGGSALVAARQGALAALALAWLRGLDAAPVTTRLALALTDESALVRQQAADALEKGRREGRTVAIETRALAPLLDALAHPDRTEAVFATLYPHVAYDRASAADVLARLEAGPLPPDCRAADLARVCLEVVEGRHHAPCRTCGSLGAEEVWGESIGSPDVPPPPEFKRLQPCADHVYRCPACGTYFELAKHEQTFLAGNSTWDSYVLTRSQRSADELAVYDHVVQRNSDALLCAVKDPDRSVRLAALNSLVALVADGLDIGSIEPTLHEMTASKSSDDVQWAATRVLATHLLRTDRPTEVVAFLSGGSVGQQYIALIVLSEAAFKKWPGAPACFAGTRDRVWAFSMDRDFDSRLSALAILERVGLEDPEKETTLATAMRHLESDQYDARSAATHVLAAAANRGMDIVAALPRLGTLLRKRASYLVLEYENSALAAIAAAAKRGADVAALLPMVVNYVDLGAWSVIDVLQCMLEHSVDISSAFERLATVAERSSSEDGRRALTLLEQAAQRGADLSAVAAPLKRLASRVGEEGKIAVRIQELQQGRRPAVPPKRRRKRS